MGLRSRARAGLPAAVSFPPSSRNLHTFGENSRDNLSATATRDRTLGIKKPIAAIVSDFYNWSRESLVIRGIIAEGGRGGEAGEERDLRKYICAITSEMPARGAR